MVGQMMASRDDRGEGVLARRGLSFGVADASATSSGQQKRFVAAFLYNRGKVMHGPEFGMEGCQESSHIR